MALVPPSWQQLGKIGRSCCREQWLVHEKKVLW